MLNYAMFFAVFQRFRAAACDTIGKAHIMGERKDILVVDDERTFAEFVRSVLVERGHDVRTAHDGKEGLERIRSKAPDLLVLDISMPRMGGIELYTRIASPYGRTPFPVLVLTAVGELNDFFTTVLVDGFITKPFQIGDFLARVDAALSGATEPLVYLVDEPTEESEAVHHALLGERFRVARFESAEAAAGADGPRPADLVLLDSERRGPRLKALVERLRRIRGLETTPIVAYSREGSAADAEAARRAGIDRFSGPASDLKRLFFAIRQAVGPAVGNPKGGARA
jgi:DNA-binding response OmpR family regulator